MSGRTAAQRAGAREFTMSLMEMLGLTVAVMLLGYLARNMLELGSGAKRLPPARPSAPRSPHDPLTMSWDEPETRDAK